jgi:hypothetical protein
MYYPVQLLYMALIFSDVSRAHLIENNAATIANLNETLNNFIGKKSKQSLII